MRRWCRCEIGDDCTKISLCELTNLQDEWQEEIDGLNEQIERLREERNEAVMKMQGCELEIERLRSALESIAKNTCCDKCQEAALVARNALKERDDA